MPMLQAAPSLTGKTGKIFDRALAETGEFSAEGQLHSVDFRGIVRGVI